MLLSQLTLQHVGSSLIKRFLTCHRPQLLEGCVYEIHGFSDNSEIGYAAVVYMRIVDPHGKIDFRLIVGKSTVAPVKVQSLQCLELCGVLLLACLFNYVSVEFKDELSLSSLTNELIPKLSRHGLTGLHTMANKVSELQDLTQPSWWKHVCSEDNHADCASRGLWPAQLLNHHLW
ncbi:hypothetical protein PR048_029607 [Dryococelus australis]|uniref:Uncharacterized protein n=1 Tax=Dryococelus australis TaxID=614101 RepID=A0ABQ9GGB5_9NEOP|nr:hypothetical protein PR048_029607 [Dryococelus australis]